MILQFKNCYILPQPRKPAVPLAFPFFHYIYVSRLSDPLPHYKQQKPVTHSTHAIRLSFLDRALPTFSPNLFSSCSASAFCLPLSERRLFLCTCQVVTLLKCFVFFDMICVQTLCLHNPFSVFLYRLRANKSSRFRMRFTLSSSSFVVFSSCCSPLMLWAA